MNPDHHFSGHRDCNFAARSWVVPVGSDHGSRRWQGTEDVGDIRLARWPHRRSRSFDDTPQSSTRWDGRMRAHKEPDCADFPTGSANITLYRTPGTRKPELLDCFQEAKRRHTTAVGRPPLVTISNGFGGMGRHVLALRLRRLMLGMVESMFGFRASGLNLPVNLSAISATRKKIVPNSWSPSSWPLDFPPEASTPRSPSDQSSTPSHAVVLDNLRRYRTGTGPSYQRAHREERGAHPPRHRTTPGRGIHLEQGVRDRPP